MAPALQISIPTASTASPESKPYTLYHITLALPLRKHEIKKRYSDFQTLHTSLVAQTGLAPPALLPAKSWLRRTVGNEALTEERRQGLEGYLKTILEAEDSRWRSSSAWRAFLDLPSGTSTVTANGSLSKSRRDSTSISDPNQWLDAHRELKTQIHNARQLLKQREAVSTVQTQHSLSADAKASLVRAATTIAQLEDGLKRLSSASKGDDAGWGGSSRLGDGEIRRRRDLLGAAKKEVEGLEALLRSMATKNISNGNSSGPNAGVAATEGDKAALWRGTSAGPGRSGRVLGGPLKETERTRELGNNGVLQLQQQIMQEQDEDVMSLGKTVSRLKDMGIIINEELAVQNEMLDLMGSDVDRLQGKLDVGKARMKKIH